ncbi:MAG: hypothetical protein IJI96_02615 [Methanobrevibacter sp.]|nr:hypothetical protein [Methanobrevibacter sp.]MBQ6627399.1 hypothetical protein [Methanobrevibacter sp.]
MNNICVDETGEIEEELTKQTIGSLFDYLHFRLDKTGKPVRIAVMYKDVIFEISCQEVSEKIVPRAFEDL